MSNYKIASLVLLPSKKNSLLSEVFISQTDALQENLAGKIFALIEIESEKVPGQKIINFLLQKINENYYQSDKMILREKIYSLKPEHIFEAALSKTNKQYNQFIENEKINLEKSSINITIGLIFNNELYFANSGKNQVLLIHLLTPKDNKQNSLKEYKLINITKQSANDNEPEKKHDLFSNIINGKIPPNGHIFITNEALPEYLSKKQIIDTITTLPPLSAAEQIKNILTQINYYLVFSGIIIKNNGNFSPETSERVQAPISTKDSIHSLNVTEENTEKILSPSGIFKLKSWLRNPLLGMVFKGPISHSSKTITIKDQIYSKKQNLRIFNFPKIINLLKNIFSSSLNICFFIYKSTTNRQGLHEKIKKTKEKTIQKTANFLNTIRSLSPKHMILLSVALVAIVIVIFNINISKKRQKVTSEEQNYKQIMTDIEKKQNQIEANLLYKDDKGAQKLFLEMELLLKDLPEGTPEQKSKYLDLKEKLNAQLKIVRRVVSLDTIATVAELAKINEQANAQNLIYLESTNYLYVADSKQKSIYLIDADKKTVTTTTNLNIPINFLNTPINFNNTSLLYLNDTGLISFDTKEEKLSSLGIDYQGDFSNIVSTGAYNNRLYLLNKAKNQIIRYTKSENSFSSSFNWINEKTDLKNAVSMAIDGSVYILFNDGSVQKFLHSQKVDFAIEVIDPPLTSPSKISVSENNDFINILEPNQKRLIVYNKKGQLILQYESDKLNNLKDFSVDEKNKIIYLLDGNNVLSFPATHFKK